MWGKGWSMFFFFRSAAAVPASFPARCAVPVMDGCRLSRISRESTREYTWYFFFWAANVSSRWCEASGAAHRSSRMVHSDDEKSCAMSVEFRPIAAGFLVKINIATSSPTPFFTMSQGWHRGLTRSASQNCWLHPLRLADIPRTNWMDRWIHMELLVKYGIPQ